MTGPALRSITWLSPRHHFSIPSYHRLERILHSHQSTIHLNQALYYVDDESVGNDGVYGDFKSFVLKEEKRGNIDLLNYFDDQHLLETITQMSDEINHDSAQIQISLANIRRQIVQDLHSEFESCNEIIRFELEQNILARRLPQRELIRRSLRHDDLVKEAASIIDDPHRFRTLLRNNAKLT